MPGGHGRKRPRPLMAGGKLAERLEVEFGPFRSASSREPKCFLLTSIVQLLTECIFWTRASPASSAEAEGAAYNVLAGSRPFCSEPREGPHQGCSKNQHRQRNAECDA